VATARLRLFGVLLTGAILAVVVASGGSAGRAPASSTGSLAFSRSIDGQPSTALRTNRLARVAERGGPITASTGEVVNVFVSDLLPAETPEKWAEFIANLTHGAELSRLESHIVTLEEVQDLCGQRALGCYGRNEMVALGESIVDGPSPEEVVRHEYGHHVAYHRVNAPWRAIDWGPKNWASAATVCPRVARSEAFPGNEGANYSQNPGEAWAEVYRLMDERKVGITTATWPIVAPSFFPDEAALQAAELDVLQPWTVNRVSKYTRTFGKSTKRVWWIPLQTPLDGDIALTATLPKGGLHEVALVSANRSTVLRRAQWIGQRAKRITTSVCGQRSLFVRVTQAGSLGRVALTVSKP
jgi:hypothetical protein